MALAKQCGSNANGTVGHRQGQTAAACWYPRVSRPTGTAGNESHDNFKLLCLSSQSGPLLCSPPSC